jgi:hypothetical protein
MFVRIRAVCSLAVVFAAIIASAQTEFSADIVDLRKPGIPTLAKIYFVKDKRRIEMQAAAGGDTIHLKIVDPTATKRGPHLQVGGSGDVIIMDLSAGTSTLLWPEQKQYTQESLKTLVPGELYGLYAFIEPADVDDACSEWMRRPGADGETCRKTGRETVNGFNTVKYELSCYGEICRLWIDRDLKVLVKRETKWNSTELRNLRIGPQSADLFAAPATYSSRDVFGGRIQPTDPQ